MALRHFSLRFILFCGFWLVCFCNQEGFLSLSCGGTTSFIDSHNIRWISDDEYTSSGNSTTSSSNIPLRFFSESQTPNCYRLPVRNSSALILVRAKFVYNNYDGLKKPPVFKVSLATAITATVNLSTKDPWTEEFMWPVNKDTLTFCLHSIRRSPVISSLEIRPLPQGAYERGLENLTNKSLRKCYRINSGYTNGSLQYPLDPSDRVWDPDQNFTPVRMSSQIGTLERFNMSRVTESPPVAVLQTARVMVRKDVLTYNLRLDSLGNNYYIILYFSGILPVFPTFDVLINGNKEAEYTVRAYEASALYLTLKGTANYLNITLERIRYYPQINALEVFEIIDIPPEASSTTVSALEIIEQFMGLDLGWKDDPCSPKPWDHIDCEGNLVTSLDLSGINLRSISPTFGDLLDLKTLDLHNTSLSGEIQNLASLQHLEKLNLSFNQLTSFSSDLDDLVSLQVLDLQNNSLVGIVPDSLGQLENLHLLNLENNRLQGTLPQSLNKESLEVRTMGNMCLSFSTITCNGVSINSSIPKVTIPTNRKHMRHNHLAVILSAVGGALLAVLVFLLIVFLYARKKTSEVTYSTSAAIDVRNWNSTKIFCYKEIKAATNNFKEVIGRGSFGAVYLGKLTDGKLVAVKVRFGRTQLGADSFINEVYLLSQIRHQNLVCLEGFCHELKQQILVYEYLPGGSLVDHLYGPNSLKFSLSWVRRLKIAVDAAKGLDYLHNGSEPRIIHRDVKCSNILLDSHMNAKVCDFGLSKQVTQADASHVTTVVKGTAGYLDPEYYSIQLLTEKSDVYSFGVVLLELICGREPLSHSGKPDSFNLVLWAKPYLQAGTLEIVDDSLKGTFDVESMRKAALVAVRCVERDASRRPTIAQVLGELKIAYSIQLSYLASMGHSG